MATSRSATTAAATLSLMRHAPCTGSNLGSYMTSSLAMPLSGLTLLTASLKVRLNKCVLDIPHFIVLLQRKEMGLKELIQAANDNDIEVVSANLDFAGEKDPVGWTALMYAARNGHAQCVTCLVNREKGMQNEEGATALMIAAQFGNGDCVKILLSHELDIKDLSGFTPLMYAVQGGSEECVELLLCQAGQHSSGLVEDLRYYFPGTTALMLAASRGKTKLVRLLKNYEIGLRDSNGHSAYWHATYNAISANRELLSNGHPHICRLLNDENDHSAPLARKTPPSIRPTALMTAALKGDLQACREVMGQARGQDKNGMTAMMFASEFGYVEIVTLLRDKEAKMKNKGGATARMLAARHGHEEIVHLLDDSEKDMRDVGDWSACDYALVGNQLTLARQLMAEYDYNRGSRVTFLMVAARMGNIQVLSEFRENWKNKRDANGMTALMYAAEGGSVACARELIDETGTATKRDECTSLMIAARNGSTEIVELLMTREKGKQDSKHRTALMYAAQAGSVGCVRLLSGEEKGSADDDGYTALMHAVIADQVDCALILKDEYNYRNRAGRNVFDIGIAERHFDVIKALYAAIGGKNWYEVAYEMGDYDYIRQILINDVPEANDSYTILMLSTLTDNSWLFQRSMTPEQLTKKTSDGRTALVLAAMHNKTQFMTPLTLECNLHDKNRKTALMYAAERGNAECMAYIKEAEILREDVNGKTALMYAAENGHAKCVRELLNVAGRGLKRRLDDADVGATALMIAAKNGHVDCVKVLIEKELGLKDKAGATAAMYAARNGHVGCVILLSEELHYALEDEWNGYPRGASCLMIAAKRGDRDMVGVLLPKEHDMRDYLGNAADHYAKMHKEVYDLIRNYTKDEDDEFVTFPTLLIYYASIGDVQNVRANIGDSGRVTSDGKTALMYAAAKGHVPVVRILAEKECGKQDKAGWTALMYAAKYAHPGCVRQLLREADLRTLAGETALDILEEDESSSNPGKKLECLHIIDNVMAREEALPCIEPNIYQAKQEEERLKMSIENVKRMLAERRAKDVKCMTDYETDRKRLENEIEKLNASTEDAEKRSRSLNEEIQDMEERNVKLEDRLKELVDEIRALESENNDTEADIMRVSSWCNDFICRSCPPDSQGFVSVLFPKCNHMCICRRCHDQRGKSGVCPKCNVESEAAIEVITGLEREVKKVYDNDG
ncbi:Ankyrin repeat protein 1 [Giardia muris]|uniref:Ankyrin repeat protein 1 n=1 Tax=Giardia muris TaxID=5742 RepID=A0A4Z1T7S4_GIAMU|nr:Ankyrin repeat protein 1 [Giardia muris]|eukprot:TNJ30143.1 Ankyrin repeat protein 1 [Giardia muris]